LPGDGKTTQHESCKAARPSRGATASSGRVRMCSRAVADAPRAHHVSRSTHLAAHDDCARHRRASQARRRSGTRPAPPAGQAGPSAQLCVQVCSAARMPGSCAARARAQGRLASAWGRTLGRHVRQRAIRVCVHPAAVAHEPRQPCAAPRAARVTREALSVKADGVALGQPPEVPQVRAQAAPKSEIFAQKPCALCGALVSSTLPPVRSCARGRGRVSARAAERPRRPARAPAAVFVCGG